MHGVRDAGGRGRTPELARLRHLISIEDGGDVTFESLAAAGARSPPRAGGVMIWPR